MGIDWTTVIFEVINFGLLVLIMARFVFRPVRQILDERKAEILARDQDTATREAEAEATRARFETELADIDSLAERRVAAALAEARTQAEAIVAEARALAREGLGEAEAEATRARQRVLTRFRAEVLRLGAEAARQIVRESGGPELSLSFARRAVHALEAAVDRGPAHEPVVVWHSPDADPDALEALLREQLGPDTPLSLELDPDLVGGVRLHAHGREVESSAGASLDEWYGGLLREGAASSW